MFVIDVISRFVHVTSAIVLVGGSSFVWLVLLPAVRSISQDAHQSLHAAVVGRWKPIVHAGIALFLLSGFYNFYRALELHQGDGLYHALVGTKILLALVVFFIASALVGKSAKLEFIRQQRSRWLSVMLLLAVIIVGISGYVKVRGPQTNSEEVVSSISDSIS